MTATKRAVVFVSTSQAVHRDWFDGTRLALREHAGTDLAAF